ncbi:unnamed protein product [Ixodes hexagonus]
MECAQVLNELVPKRTSLQVVDLGSGKGYLSSNLTSAHAMTVLGIESAAGNNHRAETRFSKIERASRTRRNPSAVRNATVARLSAAEDRSTTDESAESLSDAEGPTPPSANGGHFRTLTARVDEDFDLCEALKKSFSWDKGVVEDVIVCGLHTCGDLASSALKLFVRCPRAKVLCLVGCCYHLIQEEFVEPQSGGRQFGFPMSEALRKRKYVLGRNARMLAAQCAERNKEEKRVLPNSLFYRALLQFILSEKLGNIEATSLDQIKVGKIGSASASFTDYVRRALNKLKLRHITITPDEIRAYEEEYTKQLRRLTAFQQMRIAFAACVEALVLLDRLTYLLEQKELQVALKKNESLQLENSQIIEEDIIVAKNEEIARYRDELYHHKEKMAELSLNTEQSTVNVLRKQKLREKSLELKSAQDMLSKVEDEARQKDKELADAVLVMRRYELAQENAPRQPSPQDDGDNNLLTQCTSLAHLYRDLINERGDWKAQVEKLSAERIEIIEEATSRAANNEQRYNELLIQLESTDPELKEGLLRLDAEAKQIMDREVALSRRCAVLENERALLQSEVSRQTSLSFLKDDIILEQLGQVEMLTEERENLKIATTSIQVKDKIIEELKSAMPETRSDERANNLSNDKLKRSLHTAMVTVSSLQALHDQKECTLTRYRELVISLRDEMSKDRARFAKEISNLQTELMKEHRQSVLSLKEATTGLQAKGDPSEETTKKYLDEIRRLKNVLAERHEAAVEATEKLKLREQELKRLQQEMAKLRLPTPPAIASKARSSSAKRLTPAKNTSADVNLGRRLFASLQEQLEQKGRTIAQKDGEIEQLKERVTSLQTVIDQTAKKGLNRQVQRLKGQVDEKEKQLQDAIADLEVKVSQLKSDLRSALEREQFLNDEARLLKEDNEKLRDNCSKASAEKQELIRKLDRLRRPVTPKQSPSVQQVETETVNRLRKEISMLRCQLRNLDKPEKPYEQLEQMASSRVEVARWEESKKWQSAIERLKAQYKDVSQKLEASEKMTRLLKTQYKSQVDILRVTVDRLHDELLQTRLLVERKDDPSSSSEADAQRQDFQDTLIRENVALRLDLRASRSLLQQRESELIKVRT